MQNFMYVSFTKKKVGSFLCEAKKYAVGDIPDKKPSCNITGNDV